MTNQKYHGFLKTFNIFSFNFFFSLIEKKSFLFMMSLYYPPVVVNGDGRKDFQNFSSSTHTISTGAPQGCVLSLNTSVCTSRDSSVKLLKFADDTTLIGLIQDGDESDYCQVKLQEVKELAVWCNLNNLELNLLKTVEMIVDFSRNPPALPPLAIMNSTVTIMESFRFLGPTVSQDLK